MEGVTPGKIVAVAILYDDEGKMLLEHRAETRKSFPGYWALFGGRIERNETPEDAVRREIKEELGYTLSNPVFLLTQELSQGSGKHVFVEKYDGVQPLVLNPYESQKYGWFTLKETKNLKQIPHDLEPLQKVWEYIQSKVK